MSYIGDRIREERKKAGLSQKELAEKLGTTAAFISNYERGRRKPKPETLVKIAHALGIHVSRISYPVPIDPGKEITDKLFSGKPYTLLQWGKEGKLLTAFSHLNDTGKEKAVAYTEDLARIDEYKSNEEEFDYFDHFPLDTSELPEE